MKKQLEYRIQFLMSKEEASARKLLIFDTVAAKNPYGGSQDFLTSNSVFQGMTANSQQVLKETTKEVNPVIDSLDPETFEVTAKKYSTMWKTKQYTEPEFRDEICKTTTGIENSKLPEFEVSEGMRVKKFNNKVSNVSEYANALMRGRVFINPKFSSC